MKSSSNLLGKVYPFFLNNFDLTNGHYLYQVVSPKLNENLDPLISLTKISERTTEKLGFPFGSDLDIISACLGEKANQESAVKYLKETILKKEEGVDTLAQSDKGNFPTLEIQDTNNIQKALIIGLRDALRWKVYRFYPGSKIDILWTESEFAVFKICGDKESLWLELQGVYSNSDTALKHPLDVQIDVEKTKWPRGEKKASEFNRAIKIMEWNSFQRESLIK